MEYYTRLFKSPDLYDLEIIRPANKDYDKITVNAKTDEEIKKIKKEKYPSQRLPKLEFRSIEDQISYLRISSFNCDSKNINGLQFEQFIDSIFTVIKNRRTDNLIIDLRWNGGGDDKNGALLYSYLTDKPFKYYDCLCVAITSEDTIKSQKYFEVSEDIDDFKKYLSIDSIGRKIIVLDDHPNAALQQPKSNHYQGNVYFVINGKTASAASEFSSIAKYKNRGTFIGEETCGGFYGNTSGWSGNLILPNTKCRFDMSFMEYRTAVVDSDEPYGHGIIPEHFIKREVNEILNGCDQELEFIIDLIKKK